MYTQSRFFFCTEKLGHSKQILVKKEVSTIHISRDNPNTAKLDAKIRKDFAVVGLLWDCFLPSFIQFIVEISKGDKQTGKNIAPRRTSKSFPSKMKDFSRIN